MKAGSGCRRGFVLAGALAMLLGAGLPANAQEILGAINGTVKDSQGGAVADTDVRAVNTGTNQVIDQHTDAAGFYNLLNLPVGTYTVTFTKSGFQTETHTQVLVSGNRTTTIDGALQVGSVASTVTVTDVALMNQTDTTNGYVVDQLTIQDTPLGTGSFTQLAIMAPGVHADFLGGSGANTGLGNQAIFANGQRDTSNSFSVNGVDTTNLFNGKTTSQLGENRFVLNTGENFGGNNVQTATSVYAAIGQALPTPPVETIQEISVNAASYDATQGAHSGAHVGVITKSGTNSLHGEIYEYFQNSDLNAAPFFNNASPAYAQAHELDPFQVRNQFGATLGGPIRRDKLFYFLSYQGVRNADAAESIQTLTVPLGLTSDRSLNGLASMYTATTGKTIATSNISPVTQALMSAKLPNGQYIIPNPTITNSAQAVALGYDALVQGPNSHSAVDQGIGNLDYLINNNNRLTARYFGQNDPTTTPFGAVGGTLGFPQTLSAGSSVASVEDTTVFSSNLTMVQHVGFTRLQAYSNTSQALSPSSLGINLLGVNTFPQIAISAFDTTLGSSLQFGPSLSFGNAGMYQNQYEYGVSMNWVKGRHTLSVGYQLDRTDLNIINNAAQSAKISFRNLLSFLQGTVRTGTYSDLFAGNSTANRYYRSTTLGTFVSDSWKVRSDLTVTLGLRFDFNGALSEKYGRLVGFSGNQYSYNASTDTILNSGLEFAGQNGASGTLMKNCQCGIAPRIGIAWSPINRLTIRTGYGIYYDRGEYFSEFSPSAGGGFNGPFGVTLAPPFENPVFAVSGATFANPFGTTAPPPPAGTPAAFLAQLPNIAQTISGAFPGGNKFGPYLFGGYDIGNKLPYAQNWTFDLQYQASNNWLFSVGYVGNHGTHLVLPIPFNQPGIATATHPINGQTASYGGVLEGAANEPIFTSEFAGNAPIRVPFIGYDMNSVLYQAQGISNYDALQMQARKRLSFGLTFTASYTWSHALDEQSGLGLFFTGNNPVTPRTSYGSSDFDQTHVFLVNYSYRIPDATKSRGLGYLVNGWTFSGQTVAQSGQPYSVYDYSGSVGSIYYGTDIYIANPIVPLKPGVTVQQAQLQGTTGVNAGKPVLNANDFAPQFVAPGTFGVPACANLSDPKCDVYESLFGATGRNTFRGPFQTRFDMGLQKELQFAEKYRLRFNFTAFNVFNQANFDAPNNNVTFFAGFSAPPVFPPEGSLGYIQHTIGGPRFVMFALHLSF